MATDLVLFWHRRDLRISDNVGLAKARERSEKVVGVFCLDPHLLKEEDVAPARVHYLIGSLAALEAAYKDAGSTLLILQGEPVTALPKLAKTLEAIAVHWNHDVEPYARERDRAMQTTLEEQDITVEQTWDSLLHAPGEILSKSKNEPYKVYTPFWKQWHKQDKPEPVDTLANLTDLSPQQKSTAKDAGGIDLPTPQDLGFEWDNELLLAPGEKAAQERLEEFCDGALWQYEEQRNFPAIDGTSRLSAALKFGTIGIRTVWEASQNAYDRARSDESRGNIQTWQQELAWREFYQHAMYFFPELQDNPYRDEFKGFPWDNNEEHFQAWCEGRTGYPIVDAAMRQLNETGWMHNRCRMIVASFLTKDLIINWQWGEAYFMQRLYDGDLCANNGGWQWSASCGLDPKPLRIFNPASQTQKYDPEAEYIRQWLPELSSIDTEYLVTGKIPEDERDYAGYPAPIVDHKQQQREFKKRYQDQKG